MPNEHLHRQIKFGQKLKCNIAGGLLLKHIS